MKQSRGLTGVDIDSVHYDRKAVARNPSPEVRRRRAEWNAKRGLGIPRYEVKQPDGVGMRLSRGGAESPTGDYTAEPSHHLGAA
jgi:hypothetical protein